MDFACTFQHPNAVGGARSRIHQWDASLKSRWRSSFSSFRGNETFETYHKRKLKKRTVSCARFSCSTLNTGELDGQLWRRGPPGARVFLNSNVGNSFATSLAISRLCCQGSDSVAYIDGNNQDVEVVESGESIKADNSISSENGSGKEVREEDKLPSLDELRELLLKALNELEVARLNSTMFEEKAQKISENAIALKDEAANALNDVNATLDIIQETVNEEIVAKEAVQKATMALSLAEARVQVAMDSLEAENRRNVVQESSIESQSETDSVEERLDSLREKEETLLVAQRDIRECRATLVNCELDLERLQCRKEELQKEVDRLRVAAETAEENALKAEEDVANIMLLAEQAVAIELEAAKSLSDAEIALQKAEKNISFQIDSPEIASHQSRFSSQGYVSSEDSVTEDEWASEKKMGDIAIGRKGDEMLEAGDSIPLSQFDGPGKGLEESISPYESEHENGKLSSESLKDIELDPENSKTMGQTAKHESQKDFTRDGLPPQKALSKKSSRFSEFTPASLFQGLTEFSWKQLPKLVVGALLIGAGMTLYLNKKGRINQLFPQREVISSSIDRVSISIEPLFHQVQKLPKKVKKLMEMLPHQEINEEEASLFDVLWLLLASVVFVPIFQKIPGGSPVLGYLAAGILIGPYGLSIIRHVHGTKAIAEFGVVFLLFNIGLELSVERLSSMKKYVFGLGSAQVLVTAAVFGFLAHLAAGQPGPAAIVIGNGLALSSTAVVLQVLQERGESTSRHGRAAFSVLLFQDLAVVVLLILIPLISPNSSKGGIGFQAIAEALGLAAVKAVVAIAAIVAGGRLLLRPIYKQIAENQNAEIFSANSLLVILGTSLLTARAGLSMALGAFLAGLLLAETEFSIQIESDIAPYRGLLLGLFFMTVGMSIDPKLLISNFPVIMGALALLIGGKTILIVGVSRLFGISIISAIRAGLLLAPGGEFAFVAFGEAVNQGIMSSELSSLLFLVVGISMALTPWLAAGGQLIASRFGLHDVRSLLPVESETEDLQDHIIICGFGRVGQIIAQLLSERRIPFVALDVRSDQVAIGRKLDLPVYFGDAGSREVLHKIGAERACAAAITLDTPGANYRTVWALNKYFPNVKTFVRAHDVDHGLNLEKAGATAVVPETLEPSLQLAAAVLAQAKLPMSEIATAINEFRSRHLSELTELCQSSGSSLGYGFSSVLSKTKSQSSDSSDDNQTLEGTLVL
ncbi:K(+) efflux antiporter 2, chloroplastic-like [Impatiens glandulifera]|uniref:K(+) efflux antiporter 2, chloroplastic-like n=1 Tax=Impatiens glandulifera TaxID=253017 RepID=UPI001FB13CED|nr:K(+) efflux antiporter 2, chloroplastic-like [Impatiens glandulifera]XP_047314927.1 K(+) efflux antiporter 2, chloroplastic-like [Impatiens glandulifera]